MLLQIYTSELFRAQMPKHTRDAVVLRELEGLALRTSSTSHPWSS